MVLGGALCFSARHYEAKFSRHPLSLISQLSSFCLPRFCAAAIVSQVVVRRQVIGSSVQAA